MQDDPDQELKYSLDTQWPRFEVFLQENLDEPHRDVGSVHAPDGEMALLNARDIFVRRPHCVSLWVVPANAIYMKTAEQIASIVWSGIEIKEKKETISFMIFNKQTSTGTQTLVGEIDAISPEEALKRALTKYHYEKPPHAWLIFPARQVVKSSPADVESWFSPAEGKNFRMSNDFHVLTQMRRIRNDA
jgi:ring-1,2-phenylacetyl-CoA epoxidase subunit PaaB